MSSPRSDWIGLDWIGVGWRDVAWMGWDRCEYVTPMTQGRLVEESHRVVRGEDVGRNAVKLGNLGQVLSQGRSVLSLNQARRHGPPLLWPRWTLGIYLRQPSVMILGPEVLIRSSVTLAECSPCRSAALHAVKRADDSHGLEP